MLKKRIIYKISFLLVLSFALVYHSIGQFVFNQTHQSLGNLIFNPGYSALHEVGYVNYNTRYQWAGFEGAPKTQQLSAHTPIGLTNGYAGIYFISDKIGAEQDTAFAANISTKIEVAYGAYTTFGFNVGISKHVSNFDIASSPDGFDEVYKDYNLTNIIAGVGFTFYTKWLYIGVSAPFLISKKIGGVGIISSEPFKPDFYIQASVLWELSEMSKIKPSFLYRYLRNYTPVMDLGAMWYYQERFSLGFLIRPGLSTALTAGVRVFNNLEIIYSNDIISSQVQNFSRSSHELTVKIEFNMFPRRKFVPRCYF